MKFSDFQLDGKICKAIELLGYETPLPVQQAVIPVIMWKNDVIVKSKTGSGKTAAFAIPVIQNLEWAERAPQALVLTPTRELALQIKEEMDHIGGFRGIKTVAVLGKQPFRYQVQDLKQRVHAVIGSTFFLMFVV